MRCVVDNTENQQRMVTYRNGAGLELSLNRNSEGYGIEHILVNGKSVGAPKRGDLFRIVCAGLKPCEYSVRLPHLKEDSTASGIEVDLSGTVQTPYATIECGLLIRLHKASNAIEFLLRYSTNHDIAARIEFSFEGHKPSASWEANLYPWAANSRSLPEVGLDDSMNRHPMVPSLRYKNKLFCYAGIPSALIRKPDRSLACLFGLAKEFEYASPGHDWRGGVNIELDECRPIRIVSGIKSGYIKQGINHEIPIQLIMSGHSNQYRQTYELLQSWCSINQYGAEAIPHPVFKDEKSVVDFMIEQRKNTKWFFEGATYATDQHRLERFGTYAANTGFNIYLDLYLGLKYNDKVWFDRVATQIRWLEKIQIRDADHIADGLYCPVIPEGKRPGFYQNQEYEIEVNSLGAYWLIKTLMMIKSSSGDDRLNSLPDIEQIEQLAFRTLEGVLRHQQPDGAIPQRVTTGGQYSEVVTPAHTINAFYLAHQYTNDSRWDKATQTLEAWILDNNVDPLYFIGAHPDLQAKQYEEGSIHNVARYFLDKFHDTGEQKYLDIVIHLQSTAFFWRCPKQMSWVDAPTQGCNSEQTHFPQYSLYSYWGMKMLNHYRSAEASGIDFFADEARMLIRQMMHSIVMDGVWAGAYMERLSDPWDSRSADPKNYSNKYLSELGPEYLYQLLELGYADD